MDFRKLAVIGMVIGLLTGCASLPDSTANYPKTVPLASDPLSEGVLPTPEQLKTMMKQNGQKIVVTPFEVANEKTQSAYAQQAYDELTQDLMGSGNTIIDRDVAKKLKKELLAAEQSGVYSTKAPDIASIAVLPKIVTLNATKRFIEGRRFVDKEGRLVVIPPKCQYNAQASIYVRVYRIPSMELVKTYSYDGSSAQRSESRSSYCPLEGSLLRSLLSSAITDAIEHGVKATLNDIAPIAYIIERRDQIDDDDSSLFRVTMNRQQGAIAGLKVNIFRLKKRYNQYTDESRIEKVKIGQGTMTPIIDDSGSYIEVRDKDLINQIKFGNIVQIDHGKCIDGEFELLGQCLSLSKLANF